MTVLCSQISAPAVAAPEIPDTAPINRAVGGTALASSEMRTSQWKEVAANVFDSSLKTKWFNRPAGGAKTDPSYLKGWIQYHFANGDRFAVIAYKITSANDVAVRDPRDWEFQGSNDGATWTTLDTRTQEKFSGRGSTNTYTLNNDQRYAYYRLNILAPGGPGDGIQLAEMQLLAFPPTETPTELSARPDPTGIALAWKPAAGARSYSVTRSTVAGGPYVEIAKPAEPAYRDTEVKESTFYYYAVAAVGPGGVSDSTHEASARLIAIDPPTGLTAQAVSNQVSLHWNPGAGEATYNLKRATAPGGPFALVAANIIKPICTDPGLPEGLVYYYTVSTSQDGRESANSALVKVILRPATPANLAVILEKKKGMVSWDASPGAASYTLKRSISEDGPYAVIATDLTTPTFTDAGLNGGRTYYYVVSATNEGGESLVSSPANVRVPNWFQRN